MHQKTRTIIKKIILIAALFSLQVAGTLYINATFLEEVFQKTHVGFIYAGGALLALFAMNYIPRLISRFGTRKIFALLAILNILAVLSMMFPYHFSMVAGGFILYFITNACFYIILDIVLEHYSPEVLVGRIRGWYLTIVNAGYVLGPLITGYMVGRFGYNALYGSAVILMVFASIGALLLPKITPDHTHRASFYKTLRVFIKSKNLRGVFWVNFILQLFYAWMVIHAQNYMHATLGLPWGTIGYILSGSLLAFVLLQAPAGYLADKFFGEKELMGLGLLIMGVATIYFPFAPFDPLWKLIIVFFITRIGASIIEIMSDTYFFKSIDPDNTAAISFFRNTYPISYIIGPLLATLVFIAGGTYTTLFVILGGIIIVSIIPLMYIRDTQ
jgi:MFS family permease